MKILINQQRIKVKGCNIIIHVEFLFPFHSANILGQFSESTEL